MLMIILGSAAMQHALLSPHGHANTCKVQHAVPVPHRRPIVMISDGRRAGNPISPELPRRSPAAVLVRYCYDGGTMSQGRLCELDPAHDSVALGTEVLRVLEADGVDLDRFYACSYETVESTGSWLPIRSGDLGDGDDVRFPLSAVAPDGSRVARRIDIKLMRRGPSDGADAARADGLAQPAGKIQRSGYYGIGVLGAKNQANLGTLWRSAFQLGAAFMFVVGGRYKAQPTDTVHAISRVPLFECDDWNAFVEFAPKGARWVAVEFGGVPLEEFEHPQNAIYILGSEDAGLPTSVLRACHATVTLSCERYASYNVAVAGSLIAYDRMAKLKQKAAEGGRGVGKGSQWSSAAQGGAPVDSSR